MRVYADMSSEWERWHMKHAEFWSQKSKDPSTKVGAVIVDRQNRTIGTGYNGFPRGTRDYAERYANRDLKYEMVVHAEINAILNAVKEVRGCHLYSTFCPCPQCAAAIIQAGISRVYYQQNESDERYKERQKITFMMLDEAGIDYAHL